MKALFIRSHGGPESLEFGELPRPEVSRGTVLVATRAAALNHLDLFVCGGLPGLALSMPHVLGSDGAGVVEEVGDGVTAFRPGDCVLLNPVVWCGECEFCLQGEQSLCVQMGLMGEHTPGTYAEYFLAPEANLEKIPEGIPFEKAAAFSLVFQTAWRMLITRGRLRAGEDVLIHGTGGGVSLAALQIAKLSGARVFATSSSSEKLHRAAELGADFCYNYLESDVVREVQRDTRKRGVDLVVDSVGADTWRQSLKSVRKGGRIVTCGATTGPNPATEIRLIFWKQIEILGSTMSNRREHREILSLLGSGQLSPVIDRVFPLERGREALQYLKDRRQFGKIVLRVEA